MSQIYGCYQADVNTNCSFPVTTLYLVDLQQASEYKRALYLLHIFDFKTSGSPYCWFYFPSMENNTRSFVSCMSWQYQLWVFVSTFCLIFCRADFDFMVSIKDSCGSAEWLSVCMCLAVKSSQAPYCVHFPDVLATSFEVYVSHPL